jgi:hypothetical protein
MEMKVRVWTIVQCKENPDHATLPDTAILTTQMIQ